MEGMDLCLCIMILCLMLYALYFQVFCFLFIINIEYNWKAWKFDNVHQGHWTNPENQRKFFKELGGTTIMKVIKKRGTWS